MVEKVKSPILFLPWFRQTIVTSQSRFKLFAENAVSTDLLKMSFTGMEKEFCVLELDKHNSWTCVQGKFRKGFSKQPPDRRGIQKWHANLRRRDVCARFDVCRVTKGSYIEHLFL